MDAVRRALACAGDPTRVSELERLLQTHKELATRIVAIGDDTTTLLYTSSRAGNVPAVELLIRLGADPKTRVVGGNTPLHVACYRGHKEVVRLLLGSGRCDVKIQNQHGHTCISFFNAHVSPADAQKILEMVQQSSASSPQIPPPAAPPPIAAEPLPPQLPPPPPPP
eukprot:RCo016991